MSGPRTFRADRGDAGQRIDHVLRRHLADRPDATRSRIQAWIRRGLVAVNGVRAGKVAHRIAMNDDVRVGLPVLAERRPHQPEAMPLAVLHEDDHLLVIDKPPGLVVHPSFGHASGTLMNALSWRARDWPDGRWPGIVHRLDKHTSGVLVVAKSKAAHVALARAMADRRVEKDYLAVVIGRPPRSAGEIALGLLRDPADRRRVIASAGSGRESVTRYIRLAVSRGTRAGLSLVRCRLVTGRMHQIRVHLAAVGCPIAGDPSYGPARPPRFADAGVEAAVRDLTRQALHAWRLAIDHPITGQRLEVVAPLPADIARLLLAAGLSHRASG
jgi:23S rRNA pseudouridine1911/1915/1917 synthase